MAFPAGQGPRLWTTARVLANQVGASNSRRVSKSGIDTEKHWSRGERNGGRGRKANRRPALDSRAACANGRKIPRARSDDLLFVRNITWEAVGVCGTAQKKAAVYLDFIVGTYYTYIDI